MTESRSAAAQKRLAMVLSWGIAGVVVGLAGVYGISVLRSNVGGDPAKDVSCRQAVELARKLAPFARGEVAAVNVARSPLKVPDIAFTDAAGKPVTLADFKGRTVLLNLWATWCVPCRKEMPTLDAVQAKLGGPNFQVVAVNIDTRDPGKPKQFLQDVDVNSLAYYADPSAKTFQDLKG